MGADACMFCGESPCVCVGAKKKAKPKTARPKKKPDESATRVDKPVRKPVQKPEQKPLQIHSRTLAKPEHNVKHRAASTRKQLQEERDSIWESIRLLVEQGMVHELSIKDALIAYPLVPDGLPGLKGRRV